MGYHITVRRDDSAGGITAAEFAHAVAGIPHLRFDPIVGKAELFSNGALEATLMHQDGEIWTKVPTPEVIEVMLLIGRALNAEVYGDEGERYLTPHTSVPSEDPAENDDLEEQRSGWWRDVLDPTRIVVLIIALASFIWALLRG